MLDDWAFDILFRNDCGNQGRSLQTLVEHRLTPTDYFSLELTNTVSRRQEAVNCLGQCRYFKTNFSHARRKGRYLNSERNSEHLDRGQLTRPTYEHRKPLHSRWQRRILSHASA
jgi:hypothetical protein